MTTSGTVGATYVDVTNLVEHAYRRCGKLASTISSELQLSARENLFFLLSDLANRGLSLWCVEKQVLGINSNQIQFPLRQGTVDVMTALYRTKTDLTGTTISGKPGDTITIKHAEILDKSGNFYKELKMLKKHNYDIITADLDGSDLYSYKKRKNIVIVLSNEANGPSKQILELSDKIKNKDKKYYEDHKKEIQEKQKIYRKENKDKKNKLK